MSRRTVSTVRKAGIPSAISLFDLGVTVELSEKNEVTDTLKKPS